MSKTKGNVVDPLETLDSYGTDALRLSLVTGTTPGQDVPLSMEKARPPPCNPATLQPCNHATPRTQVVDRAARRGYGMPSSFMSSKPDAGINHKEFGVTSEGVAVFLHEV